MLLQGAALETSLDILGDDGTHTPDLAGNWAVVRAIDTDSDVEDDEWDHGHLPTPGIYRSRTFSRRRLQDLSRLFLATPPASHPAVISTPIHGGEPHPAIFDADVLDAIIAQAYEWDHPTCTRPGCVCTSTYNGCAGEYCCRSCRDGRPCTTNAHATPYHPPPPPALPVISRVCRAWRDAWEAREFAYMRQPYPAAAYYLRIQIQRYLQPAREILTADSDSAAGTPTIETTARVVLNTDTSTPTVTALLDALLSTDSMNAARTRFRRRLQGPPHPVPPPVIVLSDFTAQPTVHALAITVSDEPICLPCDDDGVYYADYGPGANPIRDPHVLCEHCGGETTICVHANRKCVARCRVLGVVWNCFCYPPSPSLSRSVRRACVCHTPYLNEQAELCEHCAPALIHRTGNVVSTWMPPTWPLPLHDPRRISSLSDRDLDVLGRLRCWPPQRNTTQILRVPSENRSAALSRLLRQADTLSPQSHCPGDPDDYALPDYVRHRYDDCLSTRVCRLSVAHDYYTRALLVDVLSTFNFDLLWRAGWGRCYYCTVIVTYDELLWQRNLESNGCYQLTHAHTAMCPSCRNQCVIDAVHLPESLAEQEIILHRLYDDIWQGDWTLLTYRVREHWRRLRLFVCYGLRLCKAYNQCARRVRDLGEQLARQEWQMTCEDLPSPSMPIAHTFAPATPSFLTDPPSGMVFTWHPSSSRPDAPPVDSRRGGGRVPYLDTPNDELSRTLYLGWSRIAGLHTGLFTMRSYAAGEPIVGMVNPQRVNSRALAEAFCSAHGISSDCIYRSDGRTYFCDHALADPTGDRHCLWYYANDAKGVRLDASGNVSGNVVANARWKVFNTPMRRRDGRTATRHCPILVAIEHVPAGAEVVYDYDDINFARHRLPAGVVDEESMQPTLTASLEGLDVNDVLEMYSQPGPVLSRPSTPPPLRPEDVLLDSIPMSPPTPDQRDHPVAYAALPCSRGDARRARIPRRTPPPPPSRGARWRSALPRLPAFFGRRPLPPMPTVSAPALPMHAVLDALKSCWHVDFAPLATAFLVLVVDLYQTRVSLLTLLTFGVTIVTIYHAGHRHAPVPSPSGSGTSTLSRRARPAPARPHPRRSPRAAHGAPAPRVPSAVGLPIARTSSPTAGAGLPYGGDLSSGIAFAPARPISDASRVLLLFSGTDRPDSIGAYLRQLGVTVQDVDIVRGTDLLDDRVFDALRAQTRRRRFGVVFAAPPCSTFSVARLVYATGPPQLRSRLHPHGIPGLRQDDAARVAQHDVLIRRMLDIMHNAALRGAELAIENPVPRGDPASSFFRPELADHLSLWDLDNIRAFSSMHFMLSVDFPQCAFPGSPYQKLTRLAYTAGLQPMLRRLHGLHCRHASHPSVAHGFTEGGQSHGRLSAQYPPAMAALLAQAFANVIYNVTTSPTVPTNLPHATANVPTDPLPSDPVPTAPAVPDQSRGQKRRMHIDTMAPYGIVSSPLAIVRVQNSNPDVSIAQVSGSVPVHSIVTVGFYARSVHGRWEYLEIPDFFYVPASTIDLWPSQYCFHALGWRHSYDDICQITLPGGMTFPFISTPGRGYHMDVVYAPARAPPPIVPTLAPAQRPPPATTSFPTYPSRPITAAGPSQPRLVDTVWRRLGYPTSKIWQHVHSSTSHSGVAAGSPAPTYSQPDDRLAVARGRMRAAPFPGGHVGDADITAPLQKLYMDFAGPTGVASYVHGYKYYCGVVDAFSGWGLVCACKAPTAAVAVSALQQFLIKVRVLLRAASPVTPLLVRTDQGSHFTAGVFASFVQSLNAELSYGAAYTHQQQALIERLWGSVFSIARVLLATAKLPAQFHYFAVRHAARLRNVWPRADSGVSRLQLLTGNKPDLRWLRAFGCAVEAYLHPDDRSRQDRLAQNPVGKKLTDHAAHGIYLGPADPSPGHYIYFTANGKVDVIRNVTFDESSFPGVDATAIIAPRLALPAALRPPPPPDLAPAPAPQGDQPGANPPESPATPAPAPAPAPAPTPAPAPAAIAPVTHYMPAVPFLTTDLPLRADRSLPYTYVSPTEATREQAEDNFALISSNAFPQYPSYAYEFATFAPAVVQPTAELGDITIPTSYAKAMASPEATYWRQAVVDELSGIIGNETWDSMRLLDKPADANLMNCHFIFTVKRNADGSIDKFKARLVADGNTQRHNVDFDRVFSTVVKMSTVRLVLTLAANLRMGLTSLDVRQAFLHAQLDRPLYMRMPPGLPRVNTNGDVLIVRLKKSLYGLKQAGRAWNQLFVEFLISWGFTQSTSDTCLFWFIDPHDKTDTLALVIVIWVDDIICAHTSDDVRAAFVHALSQRFPLDDKGALTWVLGTRVEYKRDHRRLMLSQELYTTDLLRRHAPHVDSTARRYDSPMAEDAALSSDQCPSADSQEHTDMRPFRDVYMQIVGGLLWLAACTRPDITYAASTLARFVSNPARAHYAAMQRVLAYLKHTAARVLLIQPVIGRGVVVYADASWSEQFSTSGAILFVLTVPIVWYTRLQRTVSHSSAEAEYISASLAAREGSHLRALCHELGLLPAGPTPLRMDSKSAIDMAHDPVAFKKTKHIMREAHYLRDLVARRVYTPEHVASADMLADIFTKPLIRTLFVRLRDIVQLQP